MIFAATTEPGQRTAIAIPSGADAAAAARNVRRRGAVVAESRTDVRHLAHDLARARRLHAVPAAAAARSLAVVGAVPAVLRVRHRSVRQARLEAALDRPARLRHREDRVVIGRNLAGIVAAQALFLVAGIGILWALQRFRTWADVLRAAGLAYLLGVATVGVLATLVLVAGGGVGIAVVLALALGVFALGGVAARIRRHGVPHAHGFTRPVATPETLFAAAVALLTAAVLFAFYRVARHQGLVAWDAWAFWVPKAKGIYFFGGLDDRLFHQLTHPSYPLLVPAVQALDFRLIGSADAGAIALQYWFLLVGFVLAAWFLLRPLVRPALVWPFLALAAVLPELDKRMINP